MIGNWSFSLRKKYKVLFRKTFKVIGSNGRTLTTVYCQRTFKDFVVEPTVGDNIQINQTFISDFNKHKHKKNVTLGVVEKRSIKYGSDVDIEVRLEDRIYQIESETYESGNYSDVKNTIGSLINETELFELDYKDVITKEMKKISDIIDILEKKKDGENQSS